jgi:hypothetical protein
MNMPMMDVGPVHVRMRYRFMNMGMVVLLQVIFFVVLMEVVFVVFMRMGVG